MFGISPWSTSSHKLCSIRLYSNYPVCTGSEIPTSTLWRLLGDSCQNVLFILVFWPALTARRVFPKASWAEEETPSREEAIPSFPFYLTLRVLSANTYLADGARTAGIIFMSSMVKRSPDSVPDQSSYYYSRILETPMPKVGSLFRVNETPEEVLS